LLSNKVVANQAATHGHRFCEVAFMKKILFSLVISAAVLTACDTMTADNTAGPTTVNNSAVAGPNLMSDTRDLSITPENAYSDLFLDSTAIDAFIKKQNITESEAKGIRQFYNSRNLQYAWFTSEGLTEQGNSFWNLVDQTDQVSGKSALAQRMDSLIENDSAIIARGDSSFIQTELGLTQQFIKLSKNASDTSLVNFTTIHAFLPVKKGDAVSLADSLSKLQGGAGVNQQYGLLQQKLSQYAAVARNGGWQPITLGAKQVKKGTSTPAVAAIKKRLQMTGDYTPGDTSALFSDSLVTAVKAFQQRNGFAPTGVVTDSLVKVMNVPVETRIQQILLNMNRSAWMPKDAQNLLQVNIPSFMLYAYEGGKKVFDMEVIVGKEGTNTMAFTGKLNQIVFSPYWNIPKSIVQNEIMPAMKSDPSYLKKKNMEIVGKGDSIPTIRQLPGEENALGKVKFLFPNSYDIYLHDTPKKGLFDKQKRAYSHGCIRVADAVKLAQYLLREQKEWTPEKITASMESGKEQFVKLTNSLPVVITYYTAWVDETGGLNFRDDIYGHDTRTAKRMFAPKTL
jgi:L,D-transpeptidase YcbB